MEESHDMRGKGEMLPPEKGKRKLKTPAQIEALEEFYNEHKYPSEAMKLQFAKEIGLSEKQVSGWFCHRRLKDKRLLQGDVYGSGRQSFSNKESCSSTKQGDRPFESKEVESQRLYSNSSSAPVLASEAAGPHIQVGEDRSSGSCSASQDRVPPQHGDPSRYSFQDDGYYPMMNTKGAGNRQMVDSRYPYLKSEIENPAVSSVKRRLGKHFHEDGPLLGDVFDPLPPCAFDAPIRDPNYDPYYLGDSIKQRSCSIPRIIKEPKLYDKYRCESRSNGFYPEVSLERMTHGYHQKESTRSRLAPEYSFSEHHDHVLDQSRKNGIFFKKRVLERSNNSKSVSYPHPRYNFSTPVFQREEHGAKYLKSALPNNGFLDTEDTMQPIRSIKKGKIHKECRALENPNSTRQDMLMAGGTRMGRKANCMELQAQEYLAKFSEKSERAEPVMRYSRDVATSFSEDETGESTSSVD